MDTHETHRILFQPIFKSKRIEGTEDVETEDSDLYDLARFEVLCRNSDSNSFSQAHFDLEISNDQGREQLIAVLSLVSEAILEYPELGLVPVHINIDPLQITPEFKEILIKHRPKNVIIALEILESSELTDTQAQILIGLKAPDVEIWIDDLPTHFSQENLTRIQDYITGIKIKNSKHLYEKSNELLQQIQDLKLSNPELLVVLEEIEEPEDGLGIDLSDYLLQGYLYAKPLPKAGAAALIRFLAEMNEPLAMVRR